MTLKTILMDWQSLYMTEEKKVVEIHKNNTGMLSICKCAKDKDNRSDREDIIECQKSCEYWPPEVRKRFKDGFCWHYRPPMKHCDYLEENK